MKDSMKILILVMLFFSFLFCDLVPEFAKDPFQDPRWKKVDRNEYYRIYKELSENKTIFKEGLIFAFSNDDAFLYRNKFRANVLKPDIYVVINDIDYSGAFNIEESSKSVFEFEIFDVVGYMAFVSSDKTTHERPVISR